MANPPGGVDSETLMNCVQHYPVLYDKGSADYKIPPRKKNSWKEIAAKLAIDQTEAKTRYNSIRTNFSKYIRKLREASRSGNHKFSHPKPVLSLHNSASSLSLSQIQTQEQCKLAL